MPLVGGDNGVEDVGVGARVVVGGEAEACLHGAHLSGWSSNRLPFIFAAASEQTKASASAMSSTEVKVRYGLSGFSSRICVVRIALTTTMFAVAADSALRNESASARVHDSAAAFVAP